MKEIELRFQVPAAQWAAVHRWVSTGAADLPAAREPGGTEGDGEPAGSAARPSGAADATAVPPAAGQPRVSAERLRASYFDTPARDLAQAGFALRLRLEGDTWVQTLKGAAPDGMTRLEHNVPVGSEAGAHDADGGNGAGGAAPTLDIARHAGHAAGQALQALLERLGRPTLQALFRTDIERLSRALVTPFGEVELALDHGLLLAGEGVDERHSAVAELEIELKAGEPRAVLEVAREWAVRQFGLTLELRTKALRGDLLARCERAAPARLSEAVPWRSGQSQAQALASLLKASVEPVLGNAAQIIAGPHLPEHLHQLRVALRRLRVGVELLAGDDAALLSLAEGARQLGALLAPARDADVQAQARWRADLDAAWQRTAVATRAPARGDVAQAPTPADPARLLAEPQWQDWMLSIVAWLVRGGTQTGAIDEVARRVDELGDKALRLARRFDRLDVEGRHHLRRRLRRWKMALECCAGLAPYNNSGTGAAPGKPRGKGRGDGGKGKGKDWPREATQAIARVQQVQKPLGDLNDLEVGLAHARESLVRAIALGDAYGAARAGFELGWLTPLRDSALAKVRRRVKRLKPLKR